MEVCLMPEPTPIKELPMSDMQLMQVCIEDAKEITFPSFEGILPATLLVLVMQTAFEFFRHRAHWLSENPIEEYHDRVRNVAGKINADTKARYETAAQAARNKLKDEDENKDKT